MAKLLVTLQGVALREVSLSDGATTIGRRSRNRVVMDGPGVSGEHAVVRGYGSAFYIEDLGSTNGTLVNGQPVRKRILRSGDCIEIGEYRLKFLAESAETAASPPVANSFDEAPRTFQQSLPSEPGVTGDWPRLRVLSGANMGREYGLRKMLTRIGRHGDGIAAITLGANGCFIKHHRGEVFPKVNGVDIGATAHQLADGDVIEVAGVALSFLDRAHAGARADRQAEPIEVPATLALPKHSSGATAGRHEEEATVHASSTAQPHASHAATDLLRKLLNIRTPRAIPKRGPRPNPGARICCENLRITVQAGMSAELWRWLQDAGWREITFRPDRRHYCEIPTECVYELIECAADERRAVLDSSIERAREGRLPFLNAILDSKR